MRYIATTTVLLASGAMATAEPPASEGELRELRLPALPLALERAHGQLVIGLGLNGMAWIDENPQAWEDASALHTSSLQTLDMLEAEMGTVLLAGRDGTLRLVRLGQSAEPAVLFEVAAEGIPTGLARRGDRIAVASGGAGLGIWEWTDFDTPPTLIGRYPFIDYAKEAVFHDNDTVLVADSHTAGMWVVDVSDPRRPRKRQHLAVGSFCDSVTSDGTSAVYADRIGGALIARKSGPGRTSPFEVTWRVPVIPSRTANYEVERVRLESGTLLVIESWGGVRQFQREGETWQETGATLRQGEPLDALLLPDGSLVAITADRRLVHLPTR